MADAGKRAADGINKAIYDAGGWWVVHERWMAIRLRDGHTDGTIYDSRYDAMMAKQNASDPYFLMSLRKAVNVTGQEMAVVIKFNRVAHAAGFRNPDPQPIITAGFRDYVRGRWGI